MNLYVAKSMIMSPLDFSLRESECGLIYQYSLKDQWHQIFLQGLVRAEAKKTVYAADKICLAQMFAFAKVQIIVITKLHNKQDSIILPLFMRRKTLMRTFICLWFALWLYTIRF